MLTTLRKGTTGWIAKAFIGILVLSFAVWGIADVFQGGAEATVATVGDAEISSEEFQNAYRREINAFGRQFGQQLSAEQARQLGLDRRVLNNLITTAVLDSHARNLNLGLTDEAITEEIRRDPNFRDPSGNFSRLIFEQVLRQSGLSEQGYLALRRQDNIRQQLASTIAGNTLVPKPLLQAYNQYSNEKRVLKYFTLPITAIGELKTPDEGQLKNYYDLNKNRFTAPEFRKLAILVLRPEDLAENIEISDGDLQTAFEQQKGRFGKAEHRTIKQISFKSLGAANEAHSKLKSGQDFTALAKELGFKESDIDLGNITRADLADEKIAETAFSLKEGEFSEPVEGTLTTVILKVNNIEPEVVKTFDDVKEDLRNTLQREKAEIELLDIQDTIEDSLASGANLKETGNKLNVKFLEIDAVDLSGKGRNGEPVADLPNAPGLLSSAFQSDINVENDPLEISGGGIVWFEVQEVVAEKLKPFETVRNEVEAAWNESEQARRLSKLSQEIIEKARSGESLDDLAKNYNAEVKTSMALKRNEDTSDLPRGAVLQAFGLPKNGFGSASLAEGKGRVIFQVSDIRAPEKLSAKDEEGAKRSLEAQLGSDFLVQYITGLRDSYGVSINEPTFRTLTGANSL